MASRRDYEQRWEETFGGLNAPAVRMALTAELHAMLQRDRARMEAVERLTGNSLGVTGQSLVFPVSR